MGIWKLGNGGIGELGHGRIGELGHGRMEEFANSGSWAVGGVGDMGTVKVPLTAHMQSERIIRTGILAERRRRYRVPTPDIFLAQAGQGLNLSHPPSTPPFPFTAKASASVTLNSNVVLLS